MTVEPLAKLLSSTSGMHHEARIAWDADTHLFHCSIHVTLRKFAGHQPSFELVNRAGSTIAEAIEAIAEAIEAAVIFYQQHSAGEE